MHSITPDVIERAIVRTDYFTAAEGIHGALGGPEGVAQAARWGLAPPAETLALGRLHTVTICALTLSNGHVQVGVNYGPVDAALHDTEFARKAARADAIDRLWPVFGFGLREQLASVGSKVLPGEAVPSL